MTEEAVPTDELKLTRHYVIGSQDELHLRQYDSNGSGKPLMMLHPAPYSGAWFETVMPLITVPEVIFAPDYPGYGGSTGPDELPDIRYFAEAMLEILYAAETESADILGFHTGCLVAAEMALLDPEMVSRLLLIDVPYFTGPMREEMYESAAAPKLYNEDPDCLRKGYEFNVTDKLSHIDFPRAFDLFVESLRPGLHAHQAFHAAFSYDAEAAFKQLDKPGIVVATQSGLLEPTREAGKALSHMAFSERLDIARSVFESAAEESAAEINAFLASD